MLVLVRGHDDGPRKGADSQQQNRYTACSSLNIQCLVCQRIGIHAWLTLVSLRRATIELRVRSIPSA